MTAALTKTQVTDGDDAGSWNTNTIWGGYGGRVYTTAMATMCLEVYYRYAPAPSRRGDVGRPRARNRSLRQDRVKPQSRSRDMRRWHRNDRMRT